MLNAPTRSNGPTRLAASGFRRCGDGAGAQRAVRYAGDVRGRRASLRQPARAGDLFADPAHDLARNISQRASGDGFKVLLSGQRGDELFAGYAHHRIAPFLRQLRLGVAGKAAELAISRRGSGLHAEYLTRISRAASDPNPRLGR